MHCGGVVLSQMIGIKPSLIEALNLIQSMPINLIQRHTGYGFNVVKDSKLKWQFITPHTRIGANECLVDQINLTHTHSVTQVATGSLGVRVRVVN